MNKKFNYLYLIVICFLLTTVSAFADGVSRKKLLKIIKMQNRISKDTKLYQETFSILLKKPDRNFLNAQYKSIKTSHMPSSELIGDTIYYKNKQDLIKIKIDFTNRNKVSVHGVDWVFNEKISIAQNYNHFRNLFLKKVGFSLGVSTAYAQNMSQESYPMTVALAHFSAWLYMKPEVYIPENLDELLSEGNFSGSRYCTLNENEKEVISEIEDTKENSNYYKWLMAGVFPGYVREFDSISENYLADERKKDNLAFPNGITSFSSLKSRYNESLDTVDDLDDVLSKGNLSFYNQTVGPMIESDMRYLAHILGKMNSEVTKLLAQNESLKACGGQEGYLNCFLNNRNTAVKNNINYEKIEKILEQRNCVGELLQRRQIFQKAYYQDYYCSKKNLSYDPSIEKHSKDGVYLSTVQNCMAAVEAKFPEKKMLCSDKESSRLYDVKTKNFSSLVSAEICENYFDPICFRKNSNVATMVKCDRPGEKCACIPHIDRLEGARKFYQEKSGGSR